MEKVTEKKKLNILVVFNSLMGVIGGGSRHIIEVSDYWCEKNKVDFLISKSGYEVAREHIQKKQSPNKDVIIFSAPFDNSKNLFLVYPFRIISNFIMSLTFKRKYDVIIAPNYLPQNMIPAIFFKKFSKAKLVVYFHTTPPDVRKDYIDKLNPLRKQISLANWALTVWLAEKFYDIIFVVNNVTKDYFIKRGNSPDKIILATNGVDRDKIKNIKVTNKEYDACFLGRLVKNKGVFDLVQIWKIVTKKYPSARICIIGDGPEKNNLIQEIKEEGLVSNIFLAGQREGNEKYELMKKSRFFVYPSYYEAQPVVLLEALSCDLKVFAYDLSSYDEFFKGNIYTSKLYDINQMANQILTFIDIGKERLYDNEGPTNTSFIKNWKDIAEEQLSNIT